MTRRKRSGSDATRPFEYSGFSAHTGERQAWQALDSIWSFDADHPRIFGIDVLPNGSDARAEANDDPLATTVNGKPGHRPPKPVAAPTRSFGMRSLRAIYVWEGVVERVTDDGFEARLTPLEPGVDSEDRSTREFTEFGFDEVANVSDRELIQPGAIFYWTIGKRTNAAGTIVNDSLVRFRRLPEPGVYQQSLAAEEAVKLLEALGDDDHDGAS